MNHLSKIINDVRAFYILTRLKLGLSHITWHTGPGYYFIFPKRGQIEEFEMKSGEIGIYELYDFKFYIDPGDMIERADYIFIGYKGKKPIKECNLKEFKKYYYEKILPGRYEI